MNAIRFWIFSFSFSPKMSVLWFISVGYGSVTIVFTLNCSEAIIAALKPEAFHPSQVG